MRPNRTDRLLLMPWVVLVTVLGLTAGAAVVRSGAVSDGQQAAVEAAEGHFRDVVTDHENRSIVVSQAYERVLLGAVFGLESPVSLGEVEQRLEVLAANELPGSMEFLVAPSGAESVLLSDDPLATEYLYDISSSLPGLWVAPVETTEDVVVVGYTTVLGDAVAAVVSTLDLLDSPVEAQEHGHGVAVTLTPIVSAASPLATNDQSSAMADHPAQADGHTSGDHALAMTDHDNTGEGHSPDTSTSESTEVGHLHKDVHHLHEGPTAFAASRELVMFDVPWTLDVVAGEDFLTIPSSREVALLVGLGVLLSFALFGLIYFLVRRLTAESHRRAAEQRFTAGFNSSPIGFAILDTGGLIIEVNTALERLLNRSAQDLHGLPMVDLVAEPSRAQWTARVLRPETSELQTRFEVNYEPEPDRSVWVDQAVTTVVGRDGDHHILLQMSDVSEQRLAREELQRRALHDELTGLANRTLLEDRLEQALLRSQRDGSMAAVMFIDVDQFKMVNDTLGHRAGDQLLTELADRLSLVTRAHDTIARFGGDEFVMLCETLPSQAEAWQVSDRIRAQIVEPFEIDDRTVSVTLSIGIALCGPDDNAEALLRDADLAMYQAKELGRDRAILFEREMRQDLIQQLKLEDELVQAINEGQLELYYQPLIRIDGGQITGFEALTRWNHPERGILAPDTFLPVASQLGLLSTIDSWALETAAHQLNLWTQQHPEAANWTVAVNAAPANFGDPSYPETVKNTIAQSGISPDRITIEITEHAILANTDTAVGIIERLREVGIRIAIDDFGTGYSSLSQLAALDIDVLKIDKSFLTNLHESPSNEIVRAVVEMARALGIPTVAEGVETEQDLALLYDIGATQAQGYLISRPVPPAQAIAATQSGIARQV